MATVAQDTPRSGRFNWWKIGFFVALFAFEVAREAAVLASAEEPSLVTKASVFTFGDWTVAEGRWRRIDGGEELVPTAVRIECYQDRGECTEVSVNVHDNSVWSPDMETFKAQFAADAITYENQSPTCVHYTIRIDRRLKKVIGVRERTEDKREECQRLEQRIEMQLGDGWEVSPNSLKGHFVPLFSLLASVLQAF
jgi:hypothetical protein